MTVTKKIWDWAGFTGLADNNYLSQKGHYSNDSFNLDNQTEPGGVKLSPAMTEWFTCAGDPTVILNLADFGGSGIYVFDDTGHVYKNGALHYTLASGDEIYGATAAYHDSGELFIYFFTRGKMHRMDLQDPVGVDVDYKTFHADSSMKSPLNVYGNVYFSSENYFYKMDIFGTLSTVYEFPVQDEIKGITFFQDNFTIYTTGGGQGRQYIFPILEIAPYYNIEWNQLPILGVTNLGATDFTVTGFNEFYSDLYIVSGTQRQILKANNEGSQGRGFHGPIISRLDDVYISGKNNALDAIYRFGNYYPGFNQELIPFIGNLDNEISCFGADLNFLYAGDVTSKVYKINMNSIPDNYQASGEIVSMVMDFGTPESKKSLQQLEIVYENQSTNISNRGGNLTLYARKGQSDSWTLIKETGNKTDIGNVKVFASELIGKNFGDFHQIQFKVKLEGSTTSTTPFLKKVRVIYQDNLKA